MGLIVKNTISRGPHHFLTVEPSRLQKSPQLLIRWFSQGAMAQLAHPNQNEALSVDARQDGYANAKRSSKWASWKKGPLVVYGKKGDEILPQFNGDYFINHEIRIFIKQRVWWKVRRFFFSWLSQYLRSWRCDGKLQLFLFFCCNSNKKTPIKMAAFFEMSLWSIVREGAGSSCGNRLLEALPELPGWLFFWSAWILISYKKNRRQGDKNNFTLSKNSSLPLKMDGWETFILSFFCFGLFSGANWLSVFFVQWIPKSLIPKAIFWRWFVHFPFLPGRIYSFHPEGCRPCTSANILAISLVNRWSRAPDPWFFGICFWRGPKRRKHRRAKQLPTQSKPNYTTQTNTTTQPKLNQANGMFYFQSFFFSAMLFLKKKSQVWALSDSNLMVLCAPARVALRNSQRFLGKPEWLSNPTLSSPKGFVTSKGTAVESGLYVEDSPMLCRIF